VVEGDSECDAERFSDGGFRWRSRGMNAAEEGLAILHCPEDDSAEVGRCSRSPHSQGRPFARAPATDVSV